MAAIWYRDKVAIDCFDCITSQRKSKIGLGLMNLYFASECDTDCTVSHNFTMFKMLLTQNIFW